MSHRISRFAGVLCAVAALCAVPGNALAAPIPLFSTGTDVNGDALPVGGVDAHYTVEAGSGNQFPGAGNFLNFYNPNTYAGSTAYHPAFEWGLGDATSGETSCDTGNCDGFQAWTYRTTFDLTGFDVSSVVVLLSGYFDDMGELALNGTLLPTTYRQYVGVTPLGAITTGFVEGLNTLDIVTYNQGGAGGIYLKVESAEANPVPEPGSLVLLGLGLAGFGVVRRRTAA